MKALTKSVCPLRAAIRVGAVAMTLAFGAAEPSAGANLIFRVVNDSSYTIKIVYMTSEGNKISSTNLAPNGTKDFVEGGGDPSYNRKYELYFSPNGSEVRFAYGELKFRSNSMKWVSRESLEAIIQAENRKGQSGDKKKVLRVHDVEE